MTIKKGRSSLLKLTALVLCAVMLLPLGSCHVGNNSEGEKSSMESGIVSEAESSRELIQSERAAKVWNSEWAHADSGFKDEKTIYGFDFYKDRVLSEDDASAVTDGDYKYLFYGENNTRIVNLSDGYAFSLPEIYFEPDYSLSAYRSKYISNNFTLTVTTENQNPYGNNERGWEIYLTEWLNRYIDNIEFLSANNIRRVKPKQETTALLEGYTVLTYNMEFLFPKKYEYPNYDIAIVRKNGEYVQFYLFVMKSSTKQAETLEEIVKSFTECEKVGTSKNEEKAFEVKIPEFWSDETKAYYNKLREQENVDWGMFVGSMPDDDSSNYSNMLKRITDNTDRLSTAMDHTFELMPTYTHIGWADTLTGFPSKMAEELAGGDGFNGKPVLHFTYQFTTLNNTNLAGYTPMFDITTGKYDAHFREIAQDIKAYGKPVLFRLNNEMNTDWVSYCGIVTLLDPDIFIETWQRMYDIFVEEGVDNCIWIFNPIAKTTPYSNWGEWLNYMPGTEYVQMLGLTSYEMNNETTAPNTFKDMYTYVYEKSMPYFDNYPWIISEFACGAGGEVYYDWGQNKFLEKTLGRNENTQAAWVKAMFDIFNDRDNPANDFAKRIKGAVWFSTNDYADVDGKSRITNYLALDKELTKTLEAFKKGMAD